ncbi:MAG: hypothetical protein FAF04_04555 [Epsilonproteobacteria bacterium]|nr:hypothetical protein [Campylobacterota bacterium]
MKKVIILGAGFAGLHIFYKIRHQIGKKAIDKGITKDPTLVLDGAIFLEGLTQAEDITKAFEKLL